MTTSTARTFETMELAFDVCRETNHPITAVVNAETWKLYPSGFARKLTPAVGKSTIARRTRRLPQPLDWTENEARYQESEAQHSDDANEHRNENH